MKKPLSIIFLFLSLFATSVRADGKWTLYPSYANITEISPAGNVCFALASGSIFAYNATDGELTTYDKAGVMSDMSVSHIMWANAARRLVVVYDNSNIDLLSREGEVTNVPDLYLKTTTLDKTINSIYIDGMYAYLATAFGVVKLNTRDAVIADTYQLDIDVKLCFIKDGYIYASSDKSDTTLRGKLTDNLVDKSQWTRIGGYTAMSNDRLNVKDENSNMWWTTSADGKLTYYNVDTDGNLTYHTEGVMPNSPASNYFYKLYAHGGKLYSVGGMWSHEADARRTGEVKVWDGSEWSLFEQPSQDVLGHRNEDYLCLDFDPKKEGHVMVGAKSGLYEFQDGKFVKCYNTDNSPLESSTANLSKNYVVVSTLAYNADGNLWLINRYAADPIKRLSPSGEWTSFTHSEMTGDYAWDLRSLFLSPTYGYYFFVNNNWEAARLYAYDPAADKLYTLGGPTFTNEDGASIKPYYMFGTTEDKDGNIWLATASGPLYLTRSDVAAGNGLVTQHKVPRNDGTNLADYLLTNVETRCIAIDGGNRKWIGTSNGVFLISDDCNTQLAHFTKDNSPLSSDMVYDILPDPNSNIVYIATDKGLCSYRSDATTPSDEMTKDNVYAYPNPVTPDFTGNVTIVGLSYNADVKIVTTSGTLVNEGRSTGGSYQWNCCDLKGKRVASGIYMVETATETGGKGTVCKVAIIN